MLEDAEKEQTELVKKVSVTNTEYQLEKRPFFKKLRIIFSAREKILNNFKTKIFLPKDLHKTPILI